MNKSDMCQRLCSKFCPPTSMKASVLRYMELRILWNIQGIYGISLAARAFRATNTLPLSMECQNPATP